MNLDGFAENRACNANSNKNASISSNSSSSSPRDDGIFPLKNLRKVNNDDLYHVLNSNNRNISSNFYLITQYILQGYFKAPYGELRTLKLIDLIVDQTFTDSLTLRKLNKDGDGVNRKAYEYFGTVARQEDITRCPIFALATYFVIRWSHPNPPITVENFDRIRLLDSNRIICWNREIGELDYTRERSQVSRSFSIESFRELTDIIFPWMPSLRQDMEVIDRTNYKLHSFLELFEFMAQVIVQDLKFLELHPGLLSNIVAFVAKFIPDLFQHAKFRNISSSSLGGRNPAAKNKIINEEESHFLDLSKRLTIENVRLAQQITQLKNGLSDVQSMCEEILKLQRLLIGGSHGNNTDEHPRENLNLAPVLASIPLVNNNKKRKLPPPPQSGFSPFPASASSNLPVMESSYLKRHKIDDKPTPSQAALDLLLSKTMTSPRSTSYHNTAQPSKVSSRYSSPTAFALTGSANSSLPQNPVPVVPKARSWKRSSFHAGHQSGSPISAATPQHSVASINNHTANSLPNTPIVSAVASELKENLQENSNDDDDDDNSNTLSPKSNDQISSGTSTVSGNKHLKITGPNRHIKYKLSRDNKTIWDLYTEWFIGLNGQSSIKSLIESYGLRRWKVSDDSHFFPTRRIIMDYIEIECDRGIKLGRFPNRNQSREDIRKIIVGDLEQFRINNGLTLNSLSLYFKNLTKENKEICIFQNFKNWPIRAMMEEEKNKYCKRQHTREVV